MFAFSARLVVVSLSVCCLPHFFVGHTEAQPPTAGSVATQTVQKAYEPGDVHLEQSRVYIYVGKTGFGHEHAVAGGVKLGHVRLGAEQNAGKLIFEMANFVADPDYARQYLRLEGTTAPSTQSTVTQNMLGPSVLSVGQFPTASFAIHSALPTGKLSRRKLPIYELDGEFTLHGTKRPLKLQAEIEQREGWTRIFGQFSMKQTDFGIKPFTKALGTIGVADQLTVYGDLWIANAKVTAKTQATIR